MSFGAILAFLVLVAAFVLLLVGRMEPTEAACFGALARAILVSPFPGKWPGQP